MADPYDFGPGVREVIGDGPLVEIDCDGAVFRLRSAQPDRAIVVLHQRAADTDALLDEADRLGWLAARGPAPAVIASGRADGGDEALVLRLGVEATPAGLGHPMGPEALIRALAEALRQLHAIEVAGCPFVAGEDSLRAEVEARLLGGGIPDPVDGPYAGRSAASLLAVLDDLLADLAPADSAVFVHGALTADRVWFDPGGSVAFTGWWRAGTGDRHLDLAAAARLVTELHGAGLVAPLLDIYGLDDVDPRRLDAFQLLVHLLS